VGDRGANARHFVGRDGHANARTTDQDRAIDLATRDGLGHCQADVRVIDRIARVPEVADRHTRIGPQPVPQRVLQRRAGGDGVLRNVKPGGNLVTDQQFEDFQLHIEFRYGPKGNSGVYLRGRYEVQVLDGPSAEPDAHLQGGIYGFLTPSAIVTNGPGAWNTFDITLVGRQVTIVVNGTTVISEQAIPGITGGALESDEGAPGPLMLQGDHTAIEYRNIVLTPAVR
jgi:hypothetical protein